MRTVPGLSSGTERTDVGSAVHVEYKNAPKLRETPRPTAGARLRSANACAGTVRPPWLHGRPAPSLLVLR